MNETAVHIGSDSVRSRDTAPEKSFPRFRRAGPFVFVSSSGVDLDVSRTSGHGRPGIREQTAHEVHWKAVTTGNFCGFDMIVEAAGAGTLTLHSPHVNETVDLVTLAEGPRTFDAGGLERQLTVEYLPESFSDMTVTHEMPATIAAQGDTRLYARITQEDGHRAWSSPIYLFRT